MMVAPRKMVCRAFLLLGLFSQTAALTTEQQPSVSNYAGIVGPQASQSIGEQSDTQQSTTETGDTLASNDANDVIFQTTEISADEVTTQSILSTGFLSETQPVTAETDSDVATGTQSGSGGLLSSTLPTTTTESSNLACDSNPCQNGGSCEILGSSDYWCNCSVTARGGFNCDEDLVDKCDSNPCQNGGSCAEHESSYSCNCTGLSYTGVHCEIAVDNQNQCESNPCEHGVCMDGYNTVICDCTGTGYTGKYCTNDVDECSIQVGYCNQGTCQNEVPGVRCVCPVGRQGDRCEVTCSGGLCANETSSSSNTADESIAGFSKGAFIVLMLASTAATALFMTAAVFCRTKKGRTTHTAGGKKAVAARDGAA